MNETIQNIQSEFKSDIPIKSYEHLSSSVSSNQRSTAAMVPVVIYY